MSDLEASTMSSCEHSLFYANLTHEMKLEARERNESSQVKNIELARASGKLVTYSKAEVSSYSFILSISAAFNSLPFNSSLVRGDKKAISILFLSPALSFSSCPVSLATSFKLANCNARHPERVRCS